MLRAFPGSRLMKPFLSKVITRSRTALRSSRWRREPVISPVARSKVGFVRRGEVRGTSGDDGKWSQLTTSSTWSKAGEDVQIEDAREDLVLVFHFS